MEMDFGTYEGKTLNELQNDESFIAWSRDSMHNAPPEGEDGMEFIRRVIKGLNDVFQDMMANDVHNAALVIPGGMIMSMLALMGFPRHPMGEWECAAGRRLHHRRHPSCGPRDKVFEVPFQHPDETGRTGRITGAPRSIMRTEKRCSLNKPPVKIIQGSYDKR